MDTRFWGPSGWKLIHLIAHEPIKTACHASAILKWFQLLEFVLPCKYCRASFHDYIRLQPLTLEIVLDADAFGRWAYDIHNRVNGKLRGQGLITQPDPSWATVKSDYERLHKSLCRGTPLLGWDFMTSIAYSTPGATDMPRSMPDTPELSPAELQRMSHSEKNRYNLLSRNERLEYLRRWWALTPSILPCEAWRSSWAKISPPPLRRGRDAMLRWMWRVEEGVCSELKCPTPHSSLPAMKREVSVFESGCGTAKKGKTCRTRKVVQRDRVRTQRRRRGQVVL